MRLDIAAQTDVGRRKPKNEDFYGVFREGGDTIRLFREGALLCVADGLGGHAGGEIASKLAVSIMRDMLTEERPADGPEPGPVPVLRKGIERANENIYRTNQDLMQVQAGEGKSMKPMGTTLLAALIEPRRVFIGNVGDSRCYHIRDGEILLRTEDHSWVDEQVKLGMMSKAEAETDRRKNVVTRCVGTHEEIAVDTYNWDILPGDMLLLCTDGLVNMVKDSEILAFFRQNLSCAEIAQRLVALANENGGKDNITVIVTQISPSLPHLLRLRLRSFWRRHGGNVWWLLFLLVYGAAAFTAGFWAHRLFL